MNVFLNSLFLTTVDILICIAAKIRMQELAKMCEQRTEYTPRPVTEKDVLALMPSACRLIKGLKIDDLLKANNMKIMENININPTSPLNDVF